MKEMVEAIVKELTRTPYRIEVAETENEHRITITVTSPSEEQGRVIGKHGRNSEAIRDLAAAAGHRRGRLTRVLFKTPEE